jgi:YfiH family protein
MVETAGGSGVFTVAVNGGLALFGSRNDAPDDLDEGALAAAAGVAVARFVGRPVPVLYARQAHTRLTYTFSAEAELEPGPHLVGTCDALITAEPWTVLTVRTADCLPVAFAGGGVVAMVHAGWRGLAADILGATVRRIGAEFGVVPGALDAVVGVGIGPCHYRVAPEVPAALALLDTGGAAWRGDGVVNLAAFAADRLAALGLDPARVRVLPGCTACSPAHHSFRRDGAAAGRQWSAVVLTG